MNGAVPSVTREDLINGFKALGLTSADTVLVHSALSSFGYVEGGADTVIDALLAVLCEGTLAVPTLTGAEEDGPEHPPFCDVRSTPCWTGRIPETFRRRKEAVRSLHPTHSVAAIGKRAKELTAGHENSSSPCDEHSPYYKLAKMDGFILLLGVNQWNNTTMHCVEELAQVPLHLHDCFTDCTVVDYDGNMLTVTNRLHSWLPPHADFTRMEPLLIEGGAITFGKIGNCEIRLVSARKLLDIGVKKLREEPGFFIK